MFHTALAVLLLATLFAQQSSQPAATSPADLVKQGEKLTAEGKYDEALALYKKALDQSPQLYEADLAAGMALDLKGDYAQAREHFNHAIELANADSKPQALRAMAISYVFDGRASDAARYEEQVYIARLGKNDFTGAAETANELGRIYLESGDLEKANKWYKMGYETASRKPNVSDAEKNLWLFRWEHAQARIAARRGNTGEAQQHIAAAKAALEKANNPDQARFFPYLTGYVAFYTGDYKTAIAELHKADQRDPLILVLLGQSYEKLGDQKRAMEYYNKVLLSNAHNLTNAFARPLAKKKIGAAGGM